MALERTLIGRCDRESCTTTQEIDPQSGQPYLYLTDRGWAVVTAPTGPRQKTVTALYCPDHRTDTA